MHSLSCLKYQHLLDQSGQAGWVRALLYSEILSGFDLTTGDSYFTILVDIFTNHILAENIFHESNWMNRTHYYGQNI